MIVLSAFRWAAELVGLWAVFLWTTDANVADWIPWLAFGVLIAWHVALPYRTVRLARLSHASVGATLWSGSGMVAAGQIGIVLWFVWMAFRDGIGGQWAAALLLVASVIIAALLYYLLWAWAVIKTRLSGPVIRS